MRAAAYLRFSSDNQKGGESIEYQLDAVRKYANEQNITLDDADIYIDEAKTGTTDVGRDQYNRCLAVAYAKPPWQVLLVHSTSRFVRHKDEAIFVRHHLKKRKIELISVTQPSIGGHEGDLMNYMYAWIDEYQSRQIGAYAFAGQTQVAKRGYNAGGKAPYGYRLKYVDDPGGKVDHKGSVVKYGTYEIVAENAAVVRLTYELYADSGTMKGIAVTYNAKGIPSPGGSTWSVNSVHSILNNQSYAGDYVWNQTRRNKAEHTVTKKDRSEWVVVKDSHPAIVPRDLFDQVAARIKKRRPRSSYVRRKYLLSGLLQCGSCGGNFIVNKRGKNGDAYYCCTRNSNRGKAICDNGRHVSGTHAEKQIMGFVKELLRPDIIERALQNYLKKHANGNPRLKLLKDAQQKCQIEMQNLVETIRKAGPMPEFLGAIKKTQEDIDQIEAQIKKEPEGIEMPTLARAITVIENLQSSLQNPDKDVEQNRKFLAHLIHKIKIPPSGHGELQYYDPQQQLPMVLAQNKTGRVRKVSPDLSGMIGDPEGSRTIPDCLTALFLLNTAHRR